MNISYDIYTYLFFVFKYLDYTLCAKLIKHSKLNNKKYGYTGGGFIKTTMPTQSIKDWIDKKSPFNSRASFNSLLRTENSPIDSSKENSLKCRNMYFFKFICNILHKFWFLRPSNEDEQHKYNNNFLIHTHVCKYF